MGPQKLLASGNYRTKLVRSDRATTAILLVPPGTRAIQEGVIGPAIRARAERDRIDEAARIPPAPVVVASDLRSIPDGEHSIEFPHEWVALAVAVLRRILLENIESSLSP